MLSHDGLFGSAGGLAGSRPAWQPAHEVPMRMGELSSPGGMAGLNSGFGRLRMPTTPPDDEPSGSVIGQKSMPSVRAQMLPSGVASQGRQSGSLTTPQRSN